VDDSIKGDDRPSIPASKDQNDPKMCSARENEAMLGLLEMVHPEEFESPASAFGWLGTPGFWAFFTCSLFVPGNMAETASATEPLPAVLIPDDVERSAAVDMLEPGAKVGTGHFTSSRAAQSRGKGPKPCFGLIFLAHVKYDVKC
jgi:hypothetical protein